MLDILADIVSPIGEGIDLVPRLWEGAEVTIRVTLLAALLGTFMSVVSGLASLSGQPVVRAVSRVYVEFFRGTSALVQLFWLAFALPLIEPHLPAFIPGRIDFFTVDFLGVHLAPAIPIVAFSRFEAAVVVLGLNMGGYGSEVVRAGVQAVGAGQREAAVALSLTPVQRMRHVIFPQAVLTMLPPYGNLLIELLKGTALVFTIGLADMTAEANKLRVNRIAENTLILYSTLLVMYFIMAQALQIGVRASERYFGRGLDIGRGAH